MSQEKKTRYEALAEILKKISSQTLASSAKTILFTTALGAMGIAAANIDPNTIPPAISMYFTGLGIGSLNTIIGRITDGEKLTLEQIRAEVETILNKSNIQTALNDPQFVQSFAESFTTSVLEVIRSIVESHDGDLAQRVLQEFLGLNLISAETEKIVHLLSKSDQKRDEQYDEVVHQIDSLIEILQYQAVLSPFPRTSRLFMALPLVGREDDLAWLIKKVERLDDCLLVGQPGSGKTFLFRKLVQEYRAFFVLGDDRRQLQLAIRNLKPSILLVDDAHAYENILLELRQIREESGLPFAIIANSWPSKKNQVASKMGLSELDTRELSLLSRDQIVKILKSMKITEPLGVVRELVNQAEGRPGLAVTLGNLYLKDSYRELFSGDAITNYLISEYLEDKVEARYILAGLSLGGDYGMSPTNVAASLELSLVIVDDRLSNLAAAGIILETGNSDFLSVRPRALRDVLIRDVFFSRSLFHGSLESLLQKVPSLEQTTLTLISAKWRGADVPDQLLRKLLEKIRDRGWYYDPNHRQAWVDYTALGTQEATWVLENGEQYLIAAAPYALEYIPEKMIPILLDKAVGDNRPPNSDSNHPMRIIESWVTSLRSKTVIVNREKLLDAIRKWYTFQEEPEVCLKALMLVVEPQLEATEIDPGEGNSLTIRKGHFTTQGIMQLSELWKDMVEFLKDLPINSWQPLLDMAWGWVYYRPYPNQEVPDDVADSAKQFAYQIVKDIAALTPDHQGVARALENLTRHEAIQLDIPISDTFRTLYPLEDWDVREEAEQQQIDAATQLAVKWASRDPNEIIPKLEQFERQARQANLGYPRYTPTVCYEIAQQTTSPLNWLDTMLTADLPNDLLAPFVTRLSEYDRDTWIKYIHLFLQNDNTTRLGIAFVLSQPNPNDDDLDLIWPLLPEHIDLVKGVSSYGTPSQKVLVRLLNTGISDIEAVTAKGLWMHLKGQIKNDPSLYLPWRRVVIENFEDDFQLSRIFQHDPEIAYEWLLNQISKDYPQYFNYGRALSAAIENIDTNQRKLLIEQIPHPGTQLSLIEALIDTELEVYIHLLKQAHLEEVHLLALPRVTDNTWCEKAIAALEANYTPLEIAQAGTRPYYGEFLTHGEFADRWRALVEMYSKLETHEDQRIRGIAKEGKEYSQNELDRIRLEERHQSIYGRD